MRPCISNLYDSPKSVSIHARTRRATTLQTHHPLHLQVSIHARTRRATCDIPLVSDQVICFNPRTHTACDSFCHAVLPLRLSFNPRTHTACDFSILVSFHFCLLFQSTHAHGVRLIIIQMIKIISCFNPRTHTACDKEFILKTNDTLGFNPRTHTACDIFVSPPFPAFQSFNPRTHTACDIVLHRRSQIQRCFNPRTHTACDFNC